MCGQMFGVKCTPSCVQGACPKGRLLGLRAHFGCTQREFLLKLCSHGLHMGSVDHVQRVFVSTFNKIEKRGYFIKDQEKGKPFNDKTHVAMIMMAVHSWAEHDQEFSNLRLLENSSDSEDTQPDSILGLHDSDSTSPPSTPRSRSPSIPTAPVIPSAAPDIPPNQMSPAAIAASSAFFRAWLTSSPCGRASSSVALSAAPAVASQSSSSSSRARSPTRAPAASPQAASKALASSLDALASSPLASSSSSSRARSPTRAPAASPQAASKVAVSTLDATNSRSSSSSSRSSSSSSSSFSSSNANSSWTNTAAGAAPVLSLNTASSQPDNQYKSVTRRKRKRDMNDFQQQPEPQPIQAVSDYAFLDGFRASLMQQ